MAILAGISTEYYLRLEQGREMHPSDQVLDALARALLLDEVGGAYLRALRGPPCARDRGRATWSESVQWLIDSWPLTAAVVHNRYIDVLATNALARALNPNYRVGVNNVLSLLTDPNDRALHNDWEALAARSVALLRSCGHATGTMTRLVRRSPKGVRAQCRFASSGSARMLCRSGRDSRVAASAWPADSAHFHACR